MKPHHVLFFLVVSLVLIWGCKDNPTNSPSTPIPTYTAVQMVSERVAFAVGYRPGLIQKTTDGGVTWATMRNNDTEWWYGVFFHNAQSGVVVGSGRQTNILRTTDGGSTWTNHSYTAEPVDQWMHGVAFADTNVGLIANAGGVLLMGSILRTTNGGVTWLKSVENSGQMFSVSFNHTNIALVAGEQEGIIYRTTDSGESWDTLRGLGTIPMGVCWANDSVAALVGWNGTVMRSTDAGTSWARQSSNTSNDLQSVSFPDVNVGTAVGNNGTILHTTNGGATWVNQESGTAAALFGVSFASTNVGIAVGAETILRTTNGGAHWIKL